MSQHVDFMGKAGGWLLCTVRWFLVLGWLSRVEGEQTQFFKDTILIITNWAEPRVTGPWFRLSGLGSLISSLQSWGLTSQQVPILG